MITLRKGSLTDRTRLFPAIDPDLFEPIGEVTVNFAMLEQELKRGIEVLLFSEGNRAESRDIALIVTSEMSFRRLVDLFQCLVRHRCSEEDIDRCKGLCTEMYRVEDRRNVITHSNWATQVDDDTKLEQTIRMKTTAKGKGLNRQEEILTKSDVADLARQIAELAKRLSDFVEE